MSIFSNFLKLFKYEPTTDAQNTFNIQTALNDNWDKVDTFAKGVSQQMEHKADKQWMSSGWKVESDSPGTYPNFSSTIFETTSVWNGLPSGAIVKTEKGASNWEAIQWLSRDNYKPLYYRVADGVTINTWSEWQKVITESDLIANDLIKLTANKTLYVATTGSDTTGDGTSAKPFATIQKAIDIIPKNLGGFQGTINVSAGTYSGFTMQGYHNGYIYISGGTDNTNATNFIISGKSDIFYSQCKTFIKGFTFNSVLKVANSNGLTEYCNFPALSDMAISIVIGSQFAIVRTNIVGRTTAINVAEESIVSLWNSTITSCTLGVDVGVSSGISAIVTVSSSNIEATTRYKQSYGGVIIENGVPISSAPISHASTGTEYGIGNPTTYGHVKICDDVITDVYNGVALSASKGKYLNDTKAPNHQSGTTAPSAFVGEGVLYGVHS